MAIQAQWYSDNTGFGLGLVSQDLLVDNNNNACGGFNNVCLISHQQQQERVQKEFDQFQNFSHHKHNMNFTSNNQQVMMASSCSDAISLHVEKQRIEIDRLITLQNERLRYALQEQRKQQMSLILKKYESKISFLLKQKDEEIKKAANRGMELQDFLKRMEIENLTWQKVAKENEQMVTSLNNTIERLKESASLSCNVAEDAESCCDGGEKEKIESKSSIICKSCNLKDSCVIILPCRHLCACKYCEPFIDFCPVCKMVKKASIEALL